MIQAMVEIVQDFAFHVTLIKRIGFVVCVVEFWMKPSKKLAKR